MKGAFAAAVLANFGEMLGGTPVDHFDLIAELHPRIEAA